MRGKILCDSNRGAGRYRRKPTIGDDGPVVIVHDSKTLMMPDWRGKNCIESLRNIVEDGRISLVFMISGVKEVVCVNRSARLTTDETLCQSFVKGRYRPKCVIEISAHEVYIHCPKSVIRSKLWKKDTLANVPTIGDILKEVTQDDIGGKEYEIDLTKRAQTTLWS